MGLILVIGGFLGSTVGSFLFKLLREIGQIDLVISLSFVLFLGCVGSLMVVESVRLILRSRKGGYRKKGASALLGARLALQDAFPQIQALHQHHSAHSGRVLCRAFLAAIMGVGGGFIMIPAMIYLLGMPTSVVVGTSLFQIIFVTANVTFLHSINTQTVDVVLAVLLLAGAVIGAQFGARVSGMLRGEQLRALLGIIVLAVCAKLIVDLVFEPSDLFSIGRAIAE